MGTKTCPWCAEEIQAEAIKCRWCGSRVSGGLRDPREWHRGHPDRKLAGVCTAIAYHLEVPVTAVRATFLVLALFHGLGLLLYAILWLVLPEGPGGRSGFDRGLEALRTLFGNERGGGSADRAAGPNGSAARRASHDDDEEDAPDQWSPTRN